MNASWQTKFDALYSQATTSDNNKIVQIADKLLTILKENGQSSVIRLNNAAIGVHPANRGGKLLSIADVHSKGSAICAAGFAFRHCGPDRAVAFEIDPTNNHIQSATQRLTGSDNFPTIDPATIKVGTVGCSHLAQFLNCVAGEVKTHETSLCRPGETHISRSHLVDNDAVLGVAINEGLSWTVINWQMEEQYPLLPDLLSRSLNVEHHIARGEGWAEQLTSIASRASEQLSATGKVDWSVISKNAAKSQPPCVGDILAHVKLCQVYGGGTNMSFIKELSNFLRLDMQMNRTVSGDFINRLANLGQTPTTLTPRVVMACIKANAIGEECKGIIGCSISNGDVQKIKKDPEGAMHAEVLMNRARELMDANGITNLSAVGNLDVSLVKFLLNKLKGTEQVATFE